MSTASICPSSVNTSASSCSRAIVSASATGPRVLFGEDRLLRFAGPSHLRFGDTSLWTRAETGEPLLHGGRARLRVALDRLVPAGDHVLVIARILDAWFADADEVGDPLVILDGGFRAVPPGPA